MFCKNISVSFSKTYLKYLGVKTESLRMEVKNRDFGQGAGKEPEKASSAASLQRKE